MQYDPKAKLLLGGGGKVKQHMIRWSLEYAVVLMNSGNGEYQKRALDIVKVVLDCQNLQPGRYYGNWPKTLEEPIADGQHADGNQADFIAMTLLDILAAHEDRLPPDLKVRMEEALKHAASYTASRTIQPTYTNAYMMGALNLLAIGERYNLPDIKSLGLKHLANLYELSMDQGSYTEYQSPNYTTLVLDVLYRLLAWVRDPDARELADKLYRFTWQQIASQFHPPTGQWVGPQARNRGGEEILSPGYDEMIRCAVYDTPSGTIDPADRRGAVNIQLPHRVPDDLRPLFKELPEAHESVRIFWSPTEIARKYSSPGDVSFDYFSDIIGTTYLHPEFALGTVNRDFFAPDSRGVMAHFGTKENPSFAYLQFLKDDVPFCAVQHFAVQDRNRALVALNLSTNGGDTHYFFDRIDGSFQARDLRLRFYFGGSAAGAVTTILDKAKRIAQVTVGGITFRIEVPVALFDGREAEMTSGGKGDFVWVDLVFYKGARRDFDLSHIGDVVAGLAFAIDAGDAVTDFRGSHAEIKDHRLALEWDGLDLSIPTKPDKDYELQKAYEADVCGKSRKHLKEGTYGR